MMPPCALSPRVPHKKYHEEQGEAHAGDGVRERPRARTDTREGVVVCCLHRLVLSFRRISVHIVTFLLFSDSGPA